MAEDISSTSLHLGTILLLRFPPLLSIILSAYALMGKSISPVPSLNEIKNLQGHFEV